MNRTARIVSACVLGIALTVPAVAQETPAGQPGEATTDARSKGTRLQGRVAAGRRQPVIGATATVRRTGDDSAVYFTTTGPDGVFRIEGLPDGTYSLLIRREGMLPVLKQGIELKFPFRAVVEVPMEPGEAPPQPASQTATAARVELRGLVADTDGVPIPDVRIRMVRPDGTEDPLTARTDESGTFDFGQVATGPWRTEISGVGFLTVRATTPIVRDIDAHIYLVQQPPDYDPSPLDLLPREQPIPPGGWNEASKEEQPETDE